MIEAGEGMTAVAEDLRAFLHQGQPPGRQPLASGSAGPRPPARGAWDGGERRGLPAVWRPGRRVERPAGPGWLCP
ncbi:hypothetical protein [Streptomyces sp. NPDC003719]